MRFWGKGHDESHTFAHGLTVALAYCASFVVAWYSSKDQWYLPAGIRLSALLFLPLRMWPYIFLGDAAALLCIRMPMLHKYTLVWCLLSPILLAPLVSLVPWLFRSRIGDIAARERMLPIIALVTATWSSVVSMPLNYFLGGPAGSVTAQKLVRFVTGDYLGMLMLCLPAIIWLRRAPAYPLPEKFLRDSTGGVAIVAFLSVLVLFMPDAESEFRQSLMMLMLVPAAALTFLYGWRGAAIGVVAVNLAVGLTLSRLSGSGVFDAQAFIVQQALAVAATSLFLLGSIISQHYQRARSLGFAEQQAMKLARSSFLASERKLRNRVVDIAHIQASLARSRREMIQWMRSNGHHAAAMDMTRSGVIESRLLDGHMAALYPVNIESQGLFTALRSDSLSAIWGDGVEIVCRLRGKPRLLSVDLQLNAYRCVCDSVAIMAEGECHRIVVRARTLRVGTAHRGIVLSVSAELSGSEEHSEAAKLAAFDLESRVDAHGGKLKWRGDRRVSVLLTQQDTDIAADQRSADAGDSTDQTRPALPL